MNNFKAGKSNLEHNLSNKYSGSSYKPKITLNELHVENSPQAVSHAEN